MLDLYVVQSTQAPPEEDVCDIDLRLEEQWQCESGGVWQLLVVVICNIADSSGEKVWGESHSIVECRLK